MDYTISNNAKLFDALLGALARHHEEPGVAAALDDLSSAKFNYLQRSIDHMMNALVLTLHDLIVHPPSKELQNELTDIIHEFYTGVFQAGSKMIDLAQQYEASGGKLLSDEEILAEVDERRGGSRH
jgi:exonuclease V gamma subunit